MALVLLKDTSGIDVGLAELIIEDKMKVKSGVEITEYTETGVKFSDGSELEVDTVIFAYVLAMNSYVGHPLIQFHAIQDWIQEHPRDNEEDLWERDH